MPAVSRKQQRFFGMVRAAQKGELGQASPEVSRVAADISKKDAKDFASTKHKGLPEKKMKKEDYKYPLYAPYTKVDEFHANKKPLDEEGYDHMRDRKLEKYGSGYRSAGSSRSVARSGGTQPKPMPKKKDGPSALDYVKKSIEAKYGKGAIMDTSKKKNEEYVAEKKDCVKKEKKTMHNCAKKVCSEQWGVGECIYGQHAVPDADGNVAWYDVMFEHGIEKGVDVSTLEVLEEGSHGEHVEHEGEMVEAKVDTYKKLDDEGKEDARNLRKFGTSHNQHGHAVLRRALHRSRRGDKKVKGEKPVYEKESVEHIEEKKKGLWDNIHAKRKRGEKPAKPGDKDYPKTLDIEEGAMSKDKEDHDTGGFRISDKKAKEAKDRLKKKMNIRGNDSEEQKKRLEKKRGMKLDDHPQFKKEEVEIAEADSLAAMQARREKRLAAQRKREGTTATGRDFGRDDSLSADQQKKRRDAEFKAGLEKRKTKKDDEKNEDYSLYDICFSYLDENYILESVEDAEEVMMQLTGAQIVEIIDEYMNMAEANSAGKTTNNKKTTKVAQSTPADRARRAVQNQRDGYHGDDDALNKGMEALKTSMGRLRGV